MVFVVFNECTPFCNVHVVDVVEMVAVVCDFCVLLYLKLKHYDPQNTHPLSSHPHKRAICCIHKMVNGDTLPPPFQRDALKLTNMMMITSCHPPPQHMSKCAPCASTTSQKHCLTRVEPLSICLLLKMRARVFCCVVHTTPSCLCVRVCVLQQLTTTYHHYHHHRQPPKPPTVQLCPLPRRTAHTHTQPTTLATRPSATSRRSSTIR